MSKTNNVNVLSLVNPLLNIFKVNHIRLKISSFKKERI